MSAQKRYRNHVLLAVGTLLLLLNVGWSIYNASQSGGDSNPSAKYPLLSKRIFAESQNDILINFTPLRTAMREYVAKQPQQIGVYFEYLPSGTSIGVNDQMEVKLASLIKVPVAMAAFRQIESGKLKPDTILVVQKEDLDSRFGELWKHGAGTRISVEAALDYTLIDSDNTAATLLMRTVGKDALVEVFDALDLPKHKEGSFVILSPKNYSSILRSLYLSSYLERESSSAILDLLTRSKFDDKLKAGVPDGLHVAHKIGVFKSQSDEEVFNDCGIVYAPDRPYTLCIMVVGDEEVSRKHMKHLSKMVYGYIEKVER